MSQFEPTLLFLFFYFKYFYNFKYDNSETAGAEVRTWSKLELTVFSLLTCVSSKSRWKISQHFFISASSEEDSRRDLWNIHLLLFSNWFAPDLCWIPAFPSKFNKSAICAFSFKPTEMRDFWYLHRNYAFPAISYKTLFSNKWRKTSIWRSNWY